VAIINGDVADRIATASMLEVFLDNSALLHGQSKLHLTLQKEQALIVHCLCDDGAIRARLFAESCGIQLPKDASGVLNSVFSELLARQASLNSQRIARAAMCVTHLHGGVGHIRSGCRGGGLGPRTLGRRHPDDDSNKERRDAQSTITSGTASHGPRPANATAPY